jgi:NCS1 family nucleobase:cation symporter-1
MGGVLAGLIGIVLCPWWLLDDISNLLIFISGLLGPVLAVLLCDYFVIRKTNLQVEDLYRLKGVYSYTSGINLKALVAVIAGALFAVSGKWIPALAWAFSLSWFTGFILTFVLYWLLMRANTKAIKS